MSLSTESTSGGRTSGCRRLSFEGDTLYAQSEVLQTRDSTSRPHMGIIEIKTTGFTQVGTVVIECRRTILVYRRGHVPVIPLPEPKKVG